MGCLLLQGYLSQKPAPTAACQGQLWARGNVEMYMMYMQEGGSSLLEDVTDSWRKLLAALSASTCSPVGAAQTGLQSTGLVHRNTTEQHNSCSHHGGADPPQFDVVFGFAVAA